MRSLGPTRQRRAPERFHPEECFISESLTAENEEPQSMREALDGENSGKWKEALVVYYYNSLINNETLEFNSTTMHHWILTKLDQNGF